MRDGTSAPFAGDGVAGAYKEASSAASFSASAAARQPRSSAATSTTRLVRLVPAERFAFSGVFAFVAVMVAELEYLQTAVAAVLGFVGCKMVAGFGGLEISTEASLAVVVGMLGAGVALSLVKKEDEDEA